MKGGGMNREPHKGVKMKTFKHGAAETIKKGGEHSPPKSNGTHGGPTGKAGGKHVHIHHHIHRGK